jgi:hypothetical protein
MTLQENAERFRMAWDLYTVLVSKISATAKHTNWQELATRACEAADEFAQVSSERYPKNPENFLIKDDEDVLISDRKTKQN